MRLHSPRLGALRWITLVAAGSRNPNLFHRLRVLSVLKAGDNHGWLRHRC